MLLDDLDFLLLDLAAEFKLSLDWFLADVGLVFNRRVPPYTLDELKLPDQAGMPAHQVSLRPSADGYIASITFTPAGGKGRTWTIQQDSRIRLEDQ